jgi:hypothetical protein
MLWFQVGGPRGLKVEGRGMRGLGGRRGGSGGQGQGQGAGPRAVTHVPGLNPTQETLGPGSGGGVSKAWVRLRGFRACEWGRLANGLRRAQRAVGTPVAKAQGRREGVGGGGRQEPEVPRHAPCTPGPMRTRPITTHPTSARLRRATPPRRPASRAPSPPARGASADLPA